MNIILILLLLVIAIKGAKYEYMTDNERVTNIIGLGYQTNIAERIAEDVNAICDIPAGSYGAVAPRLETSPEIGNELDFKDYKLKITSGENFHEKLNTVEEKVFLNFYGPNLWRPEYNKWLEQRKEKIDLAISTMCDTHTITNTAIVSKDYVRDKINTLSYLEKVDQENYSASYLRGSSDPDLNIRKIQYRSLEEDNLQFYNYYMNWGYYLILASLMIRLFSESKLNLRSNGVLYLVLLTLPIFIYPYAFKAGDYIRDILFTQAEDSLPKNAFMND
jgi:hypothetical protein